MSRIRRVCHPSVRGADEEVLLDREESHHVRDVLRLRPGDALAVFDGAGREWNGVVQALGADGVRVRIGAAVDAPVEAPLAVRLYQGLCRGERMEWVIQKATEAGVAAIHPVRAARSGVPAVSAGRLARWRRIAREACKQSGRRRVPAVEPTDGFPPAATAGAAALVLAPDSPPLGAVLAEFGRPPAEVWLAVGPEGGLSGDEVARLADAGWRRAGLGPRTLRTETAGLVAAVIVLHRWADLGPVRE